MVDDKQNYTSIKNTTRYAAYIGLFSIGRAWTSRLTRQQIPRRACCIRQVWGALAHPTMQSPP